MISPADKQNFDNLKCALCVNMVNPFQFLDNSVERATAKEIHSILV